jgi:hypothetical protein
MGRKGRALIEEAGDLTRHTDFPRRTHYRSFIKKVKKKLNKPNYFSRKTAEIGKGWG